MSRQLFVNLPVRDLARAVDFFTRLGFTFNPKFTDANATCMVVSDSVQVMLLVEPFFAGFTRKPLVDAHSATEVLLAMSVDSRDEVDALHARALEAGGTDVLEPKDFDFMYQRSFADPDGHQWELFWMDESRMPG
ncbi:VOC family protein [Lysobacter humi (ex Lee et al. 2017)]